MDRHESRWTSGDWTVAGDEGHPNVRFLRSAHHGQQRFFTIFREKTTSRGRTMYKKLRKWWKHLVSIQHLKDWQMRWQKYVVLKCSLRPILKLLWGSKGDLFWVMSYPPLGRGPPFGGMSFSITLTPKENNEVLNPSCLQSWKATHNRKKPPIFGRFWWFAAAGSHENNLDTSKVGHVYPQFQGVHLWSPEILVLSESISENLCDIPSLPGLLKGRQEKDPSQQTLHTHTHRNKNINVHRFSREQTCTTTPWRLSFQHLSMQRLKSAKS